MECQTSNESIVDRQSATDYLLGIKRASNTVAGKYARCSVTTTQPMSGLYASRSVTRMEKSLLLSLHCHCHCCCIVTVIVVTLLLSLLLLSLSSHCHHCHCHVVIVVTLFLLLRCCCCHVVLVVTLLLLSHCCCCCVVVVVTSLSLLLRTDSWYVSECFVASGLPTVRIWNRANAGCHSWNPPTWLLSRFVPLTEG